MTLAAAPWNRARTDLSQGRKLRRIPVRGFNHQIYRPASNSGSGETSESMKRKFFSERFCFSQTSPIFFYSVPSLSSLTHVQQFKSGKVELPDLGIDGKGDAEALGEI